MGQFDNEVKIKNINYIGTITLYPSGKIKSGVLAYDTYINKIAKFKEKTLISFYENGNIESGTLAEDSGFTVKNEDIWISKGSSVSFYENGVLKSGKLYTDQEIQGYPVRGKKQVEFYESGILKSCDLQNDVNALKNNPKLRNYGYKFEGGEYIEFDENGKIIKIQE